MDSKHEHGHAAWTWTVSGYVAWTWSYSLDLDNGHAPWMPERQNADEKLIPAS
jgi:hypothetical protein